MADSQITERDARAVRSDRSAQTDMISFSRRGD